MKKLFPFILLVCSSCIGPVTPTQVASGILSTSQILCVIAQSITDAPTVAKICQIDSTLVPAIESVMHQAKVEGVGKLPANIDVGK